MKTKLIIIAYLALIVVSIVYSQWWLLVLLLILGAISGFLILMGLGFEQGFRDKFPLDFLLHTGWVNQYFVEKGFNQTGYDIENSDYPATDFEKDGIFVKVRLNAPLRSSNPYTISVIVSGDKENEWTINAQDSKEELFNSFDSYFEN